jgi:hypothetical protein
MLLAIGESAAQNVLRMPERRIEGVRVRTAVCKIVPELIGPDDEVIDPAVASAFEPLATSLGKLLASRDERGDQSFPRFSFHEHDGEKKAARVPPRWQGFPGTRRAAEARPPGGAGRVLPSTQATLGRWLPGG